jgi:DNA (cytosine-5)-methyltransferase 1
VGLVLSLFPGADLLGRGFEAEGFCVVRGPDPIWGGDIREFHAVRGRFAGVIGGPPCPDFSKKRRAAPTGYGLEMLGEFRRVVMEAEPDWFLMENVPGVPTVEIPGFVVQRFNLNALECGGRQNRPRTFQFGSRDGARCVVDRHVTESVPEPCCLASEGTQQTRRSWADFCELQGLPRDFDLPGLSVAAKYRAVGNGVPVFMARVTARAVANRSASHALRLCACECGRRVEGRQVLATPACRKRMERARKGDGPRLLAANPVTV